MTLKALCSRAAPMVIAGCSRLAADNHCGPPRGPSPLLIQNRVPGCTAPSAPSLCFVPPSKPRHGRCEGERGTWGWDRVPCWTKSSGTPQVSPLGGRWSCSTQAGGAVAFSWFCSHSLFSMTFALLLCLPLLVSSSIGTPPRTFSLSTIVIKLLA